ncbi:hypothetical protein C8Q76DRAFT_752733 [Earliella scabrosa]|nr:hypothetical protein C8Q76DRAFT_752733 [Earliella scabrosa]
MSGKVLRCWNADRNCVGKWVTSREMDASDCAKLAKYGHCRIGSSNLCSTQGTHYYLAQCPATAKDEPSVREIVLSPIACSEPLSRINSVPIMSVPSCSGLASRR